MEVLLEQGPSSTIWEFAGRRGSLQALERAWYSSSSMGHHIDEQGRFQSDKHPGLGPDKVVIDLTDPEAWAGLQTIAAAYKAKDSDFADGLQVRVQQLRAAHIEARSPRGRILGLDQKKKLKGTLT